MHWICCELPGPTDATNRTSATWMQRGLRVDKCRRILRLKVPGHQSSDWSYLATGEKPGGIWGLEFAPQAHLLSTGNLAYTTIGKSES